MSEKGLWTIGCLLLIFVRGIHLTTLLYCFVTIVLIRISIIDSKTYEIPPSLNVFLLGCAIINGIMYASEWKNWLAGALLVSLPLALSFYLTQARAVGGGDVKLMAVCGLLVGWRNILAAFFVACLLGTVFHSLKIKRKGADNRMAMGPYLAAGVYTVLLFGEY